MTQNGDGAEQAPSLSINDLVAGIVAGYVRGVDLSRATGKSGRIVVEVEVCLDRGEVPWSTGLGVLL